MDRVGDPKRQNGRSFAKGVVIYLQHRQNILTYVLNATDEIVGGLTKNERM